GSGPMTIRRAAPSAVVRVNGVLLGAEPTPLMHGDKLEIGGLELRFADDAKGGATQFVNASDMAALAGTRRAGASRPTAASGGRLVSLVDGKEYTVPSGGLVFGREASCDVVVAQNEVSRRHAEIAPDGQGYVVRDLSSNGVYVNGERVQGSHRMARADVVRIGTEEFRFYADVLAASATPAVSQPASAPPSAAPAPAPAPAPASAPAEPESARAALMSAPTPLAQPRHDDPRPVLATLESRNEGPAKGTKYPLRTPLAHVGRGAHNDVRLQDDSVSETHAKLQRRDDGWYVVDMGSTNGTYVAGTRITGERRLDGSPDLRFGGMKMRFAEAGAAVPTETDAKGTRAIASVERPRRAAAEPSPAAAPVEGARGGIPAIVWVLLVLVIGAAAFFLLQGRA
ncbi:MAG TPA: FHA domain-containing protein, partial [Gemmatimonadaceae bacterium]|nr:FHA domain-containing protein [Gemmatimonadaceae bacterium]